MDSKNDSYFRERLCSMCAFVYLHLREALVCLAKPLGVCVCLGEMRQVHVKQRECERLLRDVRVLDQCVVVEP